VLLQRLQQMPPSAAVRAESRARRAPAADPSVDYPAWYLRRWHFFPEGYLSAGGVRNYDRFIRPLYYEGHERKALAALTREVVRVHATTREGPRPTILDVGCGTGRMLAAIRRRLPASDLTGLDLSPFMVAESRARLADTARIVHADACSLPWDSASFDVAVAAHVLGHVPRPVATRMLTEIARTLRPGGTLLVVEHSWHTLPLAGWVEGRSTSLAGGLIVVRTLSW